jgi:hypothetical protein
MSIALKKGRFYLEGRGEGLTKQAVIEAIRQMEDELAALHVVNKRLQVENDSLRMDLAYEHQWGGDR